MERTDLMVAKTTRSGAAVVRIILKDGTSYHGKAAKAQSSDTLALSKIEEKFRQCAANRLTPRMIRGLLSYLSSIEEVKSVGGITRLLRAAWV